MISFSTHSTSTSLHLYVSIFQPCTWSKIKLIPYTASPPLSEDINNITDSSTRFDDSWLRCAAWLSCCLESHKSCNMESLPESAGPTRFIDIGSEAQVPRLCYSAEVKSGKPKYVTLSHCWGSLPLPKLTAKTHDGLTNGIDIGVLPKSFQDAILFTRRL
jgi:hypothetical protein